MVLALSYVMFEVLPIIVVLAYTLYLFYIKVSPTRVKGKLDIIERKYPKDTLPNKVYSRMYSPQYVIAWVCITLFLLSGIVFDLYKATHKTPALALIPGLALILVLSVSGFYLLFGSFKKK